MQVFISYSRNDRRFVIALTQVFRYFGIGFWLDEHLILPGEDLSQRIQRGIAESDHILIIISEHALASEWVNYELALGLQREHAERRGRIIPVLIQGGLVPAELRNRVFADFRNDVDHEKALGKLLQSLGVSHHGRLLARHLGVANTIHSYATINDEACIIYALNEGTFTVTVDVGDMVHLNSPIGEFQSDDPRERYVLSPASGRISTLHVERGATSVSPNTALLSINSLVVSSPCDGIVRYRNDEQEIEPSDLIDAGSPLCFIEVMEKFIEVRSPHRGKLMRPILSSGTVVSREDTLFTVAPGLDTKVNRHFAILSSESGVKSRQVFSPADVLKSPTVATLMSPQAWGVPPFDSSQSSRRVFNPGEVIKSPTVGAIYLSPSPDDPPFVTAGTQVHPHTVVCLIEAMKVYNQITADISGTISEVLVKNGDDVEFGQPLFLLATS